MEPSERILLVDDLPTIHDDFRKVLNPPKLATDALDALEAELFGDPTTTSSGAERGPAYEIDDAYQGVDAVKLVEDAVARGEPYGVVFLDVRMPPGMDGVETASRLWDVDPCLQIVLCTAYSDYTWEETVDALHPHRHSLLFLKKPFDAAEVRQLARVLAIKQRSARKSRDRRLGLEAEVAQRVQHLTEANARVESEVAERERLERELEDARKLEASGQLAAGIAHEINTPIQFVGDHLGFIGETLVDLIDHVDQGAQAARTAKAMTRELDTVIDEAGPDLLAEDVPEAVDRGEEGLRVVASLVRALKELTHPGRHEGASLHRSVEIVHALTRSRLAEVFEVSIEADGASGLAQCRQGEANLIVASTFDCLTQSSGVRDRGSLRVVTREVGAECRVDFCVERDLSLDGDRVSQLARRVARGGGTLGIGARALTVCFPRMARAS